MTRTIITNSRIWHDDAFVADHALIVENGVVADLSPSRDIQARIDDRCVDGGGNAVVPGFIDLHVHGSNGFDVMDASDDSLPGMSDFLLRQGVTSFLGTTMSDTAPNIEASLKSMSAAVARSDSACIGVHLEGPYLNSSFRGSQPATHLRHPRPEEYLPWFESGLIKLITAAPELPGGLQFIRDARAHGITVSIGHSGANYEQAGLAIAAGARQITHTFNGMAGIHHREPGIFVAASEKPNVTFQLIPDGVHLHPAIVRMVIRLVGQERVLAITDAMRAAGLADGQYGLGDVKVLVKDGEARASAGGLAGSTLTMSQALRNMMRFADLTLAEALPMLTRVPARSIGIYPQKGSLAIGSDADMVIWHDERGVQATIIAGEIAYRGADVDGPV